MRLPQFCIYGSVTFFFEVLRTHGLEPPSVNIQKLKIEYEELMRHGVDVISPSSWELQEEGMMSTVANFPSVRNQGLSNPGKSQTPKGDAC
jgi:hypothetical protein